MSGPGPRTSWRHECGVIGPAVGAPRAVDAGVLTHVVEAMFAEIERDIDRAAEQNDASAVRPPAKLSFTDFLQAVFRLRGANAASVIDVVELREYLRQRFDQIERSIIAECKPPNMGTWALAQPRRKEESLPAGEPRGCCGGVRKSSGWKL